MSTNKKNIVIIGGGFSGMALAQTLEKHFTESEANITIIERRPFFFHNIASLRAMVEPGFSTKLFIPTDKSLKYGKVVCAEAEAIENDKVRIRPVSPEGEASGKTEAIPFDYLTIATGSSYLPPINLSTNKKSEGVEAFEAFCSKVKTSQRIAIVGGGAVGCEMAGEIAEAYPEKTVILIDGNSELLAKQNVTPKFRKTVAAKLTALGVDLFLGDRLENKLEKHGFETATFKTESGIEITSDLQILCAGSKPTTSIAHSLGENVVDEKEGIRVRPNFKLDREDYDNIYVIGDASNHPTPKMAYWGTNQAKHLASGLSILIRTGADVPDFEGPTVGTIVLPLGKNGGVSQLPVFGGMVVGDWFSRTVKSKDLFLRKFYSELNAEAM